MMTCPKCQEEIGSMSMHYCPLIAESPAKEKLLSSSDATDCSASLIANTNQDEIDWSFFAGKFEKKYGFAPHPRDSGHQEYYHWFTVGAHAEFMGRLNGAQNK